MKLVFLVVFTSLMAAASGAESDEEKIEKSTNREEAFTVTCGTRPYDSENNRKRLLESLHTDISSEVTGGRQSNIVGGGDAERGQYPWQGHVNITKTDGQSSGWKFCGAVIVGEYWLLSAAHCFVDKEGDTVHKDTIDIKVDDLSHSWNEIAEQRFNVAKLVIHESFDRETLDYDFALIKIRSSENDRGIIFNDYVQPACLPDTNTPFIIGTMCMISGFGRIGDDEYPDRLQGADVPLQSQSQCRLSYILSNEIITDRMFCAGYFEGGVDSCKGDSGGPLVCESGGAYTVYGVTSWGEKCALENSLGVYARVSYVLDWIYSTIEKYSENEAEGHIPSKP